ncbi:unnamed protein product [Brassica oleracea]|uniref:Uncharacterized protein n=2 Tax=Brassica TaxID=3705 RepID=A0A3P6GWC9_BRAOL|nr:unnamed protein product [Brassica napus]VDD57969.1 unnamed protein product [Brassica oleracea]
MMIITFSVEYGVALLTSICFTSCHRESLGFVVSSNL